MIRLTTRRLLDGLRRLAAGRAAADLDLVQLPGPKGPLTFAAPSTVERFRTEGYGGEREFLELMVAELLPGDVFFDIGASIGLVTTFAAAVVDHGLVVAFEPDPDTRSHMARNLALNPSLGEVRLVSWAVAERQGSTTLYTDGASGFAPALRPKHDIAGAPRGEVTVPTDSLDRAIASGELPLPTVLKIDIEGAEILCLRGSARLLAGELGPKPRTIFLESHPVYLPSFGSSVDEVRRLVEQAGYAATHTRETHDQLHYRFEVR